MSQLEAKTPISADGIFSTVSAIILYWKLNVWTGLGIKLSLPINLCLYYSYSWFFFRIYVLSLLYDVDGKKKVKIVGVYSSKIVTFFYRSSTVNSLLSFAFLCSFLTSGSESTYDLLLDIKLLS